MEVTDIRLQLNRQPGSKVVAFVTVVFDNALMIHGLRVIRAGPRLVVALPDRQGSDGAWRPVVEWVATPQMDHVNRLIVQACEDELSRPENRDRR